MGRPRKPPAFLVAANVYKNGKLAGLPSDTARLGFFYAVLGQAKLAEPTPGLFLSKGHFREVAGRFGRYLDDYVAAGILELAPRLCSRCKPRWTGIAKAGSIVVHDWHEHQYDPRKVERQRLWDQEHRGPDDDVSDAVSDAISDDKSRVSDAVSDAKPGVSDAISDGVSDADLAGARARDRVRSHESNVERRTTNESLPEEDRSSHVVARPDVGALMARGWKRVTKAQLAMLDEMADRHDRPSKGEPWGAWAADVIATTADGKDPIAELKHVDSAWQEVRRQEIDADERRLADEKAERDALPTRPFAELMAEGMAKARAEGTWFDAPTEPAEAKR